MGNRPWFHVSSYRQHTASSPILDLGCITLIQRERVLPPESPTSLHAKSLFYLRAAIQDTGYAHLWSIKEFWPGHTAKLVRLLIGFFWWPKWSLSSARFLFEVHSFLQACQFWLSIARFSDISLVCLFFKVNNMESKLEMLINLGNYTLKGSVSHFVCSTGAPPCLLSHFLVFNRNLEPLAEGSYPLKVSCTPMALVCINKCNNDHSSTAFRLRSLFIDS